MLAWSVVEALYRNWALVAILSTTVVLVIIPALIIMKYARISLNIMRTTKPPLTRNPLDYEPLRGDPVNFTAFDGLRLSGALIRANPDVPRRGMIIFAHEFCSDMASCGRYCRPLWEVGYDVFTFDFRGHGQSDKDPVYTPRQWVSDRDIADMRGVVAYVTDWLEREGLPREIGVFGISRGACAAIITAAENENIRALVADGAFSTDRTIEYFMKRWAYIFAKVKIVYENHPPLFWRFLRWSMMHFARREFRCRFPSVRKAIMRMKPRAVFFVHGQRDSFLPVEQSRLLYALAAQPKYMWLAPGARHNQAAILHPELYARLTTEFFDRHLAHLPATGRGGRVESAQAPVSVAAPVSQEAGIRDNLQKHADPA